MNGVDAGQGLDDVLRQARQKKLADHPYWQRLLLYHRPFESPLQFSIKSDVINQDFFLSKEGNKNPASELTETLKALFEPETSESDRHAQCRFIARFHWLKSKIDFSHAALPQIDCRKFNQWVDVNNVKSISMVYASSYMGNPASMFGHALLKFNLDRSGQDEHRLLNPTINFGANTDPDDGIIKYIFFGTFGIYRSSYTDERFYNYNQLYGESELRDLWDYELNLSREQIKKVVYRSWELLNHVEFGYYFFLDNCAYRMFELLDMAWHEPEIMPPFMVLAVPINFFHRMDSMNNGAAPLIKKIQFIPSRQHRLRQKLNLLSPKQLTWFHRVTEDFETIASQGFNRLTLVEQAQIMDTLFDYYEYRKVKYSEPVDKDKKYRLLQLRIQLPVLDRRAEDSTVAPPTEGSKTAAMRFGLVNNEKLGNKIELGLRSTYHDLLGYPVGHLQYEELTTLDVRIRMSPEKATLHQIELLNIISIGSTHRKTSLLDETSWQLRLAYEVSDLACESCNAWVFRGGLGESMVFGDRDRHLLYGFLNIFSKLSSHYEEGHAIGVSSDVNLLISRSDHWSTALSFEYLAGILGDPIREQKACWKFRYSFFNDGDIRLKIQHHKALDAGLEFNWYW